MGKLCVKIPPEITEYKERFFFGLTIRQMACSFMALAIGIPTAIWGDRIMPVDVVRWITMIEVLPLFVIGFYSSQGQPIEKVLKIMVKFYLGRQKRKCSYSPQILEIRDKIREIVFLEDVAIRKKEIKDFKALKKTRAYKREQKLIKKELKIKRKSKLKAVRKANYISKI